MMHIVLVILEAALLLLLVIVGLLLLFLLSVLLVPLHYRIEGEWKEEARIQAGVYWLLHMLSLRVEYQSKAGLLMKFRVLGVPVWRSDKKKPDKEKPVKKTVEEAGEPGEKLINSRLQEPEGENLSGSVKENRHRESKTFRKSERKQRKDVRNPLTKLWFSFRNFYDKLREGYDLFQDKKAWLEDEKNQDSLRFLWKQIKGAFAHLRPTNGKGRITFGFEDPYTTGQALQAASLIYPFCHRQLSIHPVFDKKILEGEGRFQGRIRSGFLLWLLIRIYFHKHTWKLIQSFIK